jgi:HSP20 family molecular chaperone IbpA
MAKEKRSLFEWLTGSSGSDDYSFDDLQSGGTGFNARTSTPPAPGGKRILAEEAEERAEEGELGVDVYQTPSHIVIKAMIAGVRPEDLDVAITRDMVTLRGKRERHTEGTTSDFFFQELYWGSFARTIVLPQEIDIEGAEATEKHGLLTLRLPKLDKGRQAKIKVKSS